MFARSSWNLQPRPSGAGSSDAAFSYSSRGEESGGALSSPLRFIRPQAGSPLHKDAAVGGPRPFPWGVRNTESWEGTWGPWTHLLKQNKGAHLGSESGKATAAQGDEPGAGCEGSLPLNKEVFRPVLGLRWPSRDQIAPGVTFIRLPCFLPASCGRNSPKHYLTVLCILGALHAPRQ